MSFSKNSLISAASLLAALMLMPSSAVANGFGVGASVGTTGATLEAKFAPNDRIMLRGNFNYLEFNTDQDYDGIDYDGDLNLTTFGGFVDVAPFGNAFVLSGGAYFGNKTLDLLATPSSDVTIGGQVFTPEQVGTLTGEAELNSVAPYVGIGFDSFATSRSDWSFNARAGVMFTGSPDVELVSANGTLSQDPILLNELRAEVQNIEDDAENFKYYPVISLGVTRKF